MQSNSFGSRLRWWRKRRGMSQLDLAGVAGTSRRHVSFLECVRSQPSREMVAMPSRGTRRAPAAAEAVQIHLEGDHVRGVCAHQLDIEDPQCDSRRIRRGQGGDDRDGVGERVGSDAAHGGVVAGWWDEMEGKVGEGGGLGRCAEETRPPPPMNRRVEADRRLKSGCGKFSHGCGLKAFRALGDFKLDAVALSQAAKAGAFNARIVDEHIIAAVLCDKAIPFLLVKPLHGTTGQN
jgi:transcriptional regulator with XRE-family HTH domain